MLPAIKQNLYAEEQVIQKITILSSLGVKYVVTRYGEIEILGGLEDSKKKQLRAVPCEVSIMNSKNSKKFNYFKEAWDGVYRILITSFFPILFFF